MRAALAVMTLVALCSTGRAWGQAAEPTAPPAAAADANSPAPTPGGPAPEPRAAPPPAAGRAVDSLELETTSITGNQELPKVLYIVPWKRSDLGDLVDRPVNTLLDEVLAPIDHEVFERHLEYYESLYGTGQQE